MFGKDLAIVSIRSFDGQLHVQSHQPKMVAAHQVKSENTLIRKCNHEQELINKEEALGKLAEDSRGKAVSKDTNVVSPEENSP